MSDHTIYAATVKQVANLQAELTELRVLYADRERDLEHEYQRAEAAEAAARAQSEDVQQNWLSPVEAIGLRAEVARLRGLRAGLLAWKIDMAAESLHAGNDNAARARCARIESRIAHILQHTQEAA
jgi:hypothetical protein